MNTLKTTLLAFFLSFTLSLLAQTPATEIRAIWLTTNWRLDWPVHGKTVAEQKMELNLMLDELKALNFNTVFFQTRAQGKVFYRSRIEPMSPYFNQNDNFDPLLYAIEQCHKRGLECHAWIVVYPGEKVKKNKYKPSHYKAVNGIWHLDPGNPETRKYIVSIVNEIIENYDVDGIQLDYLRYPNNTQKFPDEDTYLKYGKSMNLFDWRRDNINKLASAVYDSVKSKKKWVQVSSSTLGRYQILPHIDSNDSWTARDIVFQDAAYWLKNGKHDILFPMMYYQDQYFYPFLDDWIKNSYGRIVVPGLGVYQMLPNEKDWDLNEVTQQMNYTRQENVCGQAYFRTRNVLDNLKGVKDFIHQFYARPAKLPPLTWLDNSKPATPINLRVYKNEQGQMDIEWESPDKDKQLTYNLYISSKDSIDTSDSRDILAVGIHENKYTFEINEGDFGFYYSVTASDRYHNESAPCISAFFSHSKDLK